MLTNTITTLEVYVRHPATNYPQAKITTTWKFYNNKTNKLPFFPSRRYAVQWHVNRMWTTKNVLHKKLYGCSLHIK